jgi:hypothetical protein
VSRQLEVDARRMWAAVMLALDVWVCESILLGRPVPARQLDVVVLGRGLRGERLPDPDSYVRVRPGHLDAIAEAGPLHHLEPKPGGRA